MTDWGECKTGWRPGHLLAKGGSLDLRTPRAGTSKVPWICLSPTARTGEGTNEMVAKRFNGGYSG